MYLRDLTSGTTTLISVDAAGTDSGNRASDTPVFSPDGTELAFVSLASDLGPTDTRTDCRGGVHSTSPVFAPDGDGDSVVFESGTAYLRDRTAGTTDVLVRTPTGAEPNRAISLPSYSADGGRLVFTTAASNLGPTDTTTCTPPSGITRPCIDVYRRDLTARTTSLVSANADHTNSADGDSDEAAFAAGGQVVYASRASNLGPSDTNGSYDIYIATAQRPRSQDSQG